MKDRRRVLEAGKTPLDFTGLLLRELAGAAKRNQSDPHLVTVSWNPNDWDVCAIIKPDEDECTLLSLTACNRYRVILKFEDSTLRDLSPEEARMVQDNIASPLLSLLQSIPEDELEKET